VTGTLALRAVASPDAEAAAFGAEPGAPVRVRPGSSALERWYVAVALGGQGRYAAAAAVLEPLLVGPGVPVAVAAHAAITLAAHRRQLGGHAAARRYDALGLRLASSVACDPAADLYGSGLLAARVDALVGLAADAVGTGAPACAQRLLDTAESLLRAGGVGGGEWRPVVRLGWVRAELALVRGDAAGAVEPARRALECARSAGSVRHVLKSRIVFTVAAAVAGAEPAAAVVELDAAAAEAERAGLLPLVWPARLAAADLLECGAGTPSNANDATRTISGESVNDQVDGPARRRHAALATLSVIGERSDPLGKRLLGDSGRVCVPPRVM
jgi:hypothetical protein